MREPATVDVNDRSRYGAIVAHEIVMIFDRSDKEIVQKAYQAFIKPSNGSWSTGETLTLQTAMG